jgi:Rap1a immunity proteins
MSSRITASLFGAALALTVTAGAAAEDMNSANYLLPACQELIVGKQVSPTMTSFERGICSGTLRGIIFMGTGLRRPVSDDVRLTFCIDHPDNGTPEQALRIVVSYIEARPARMHEPFVALALEALRAAWPCR